MFAWVVFAIFVVMQYLDVWTTNKNLDAGNVEANPIVKKWMDIVGMRWWWTIKIPVILGTSLLAYTNTVWVLVLLVVFYAVVIHHNYQLIKRT